MPALRTPELYSCAHNFARPPLVQGVYGRGGILYAGSYVGLQRSSRLERTGLVLVLAFGLAFILVLVLNSFGGMLQGIILMIAILSRRDTICLCL